MSVFAEKTLIWVTNPGLRTSASQEAWCCAKIESTHGILKSLGGEIRVKTMIMQFIKVLKSIKCLRRSFACSGLAKC